MRLTGDAVNRGTNPFKVFTRKRAGRAGSRFRMSCATIGAGGEIAYFGDAMLASWADVPMGHTVRFWLDDEAERHPFAGYARRIRNTPGDLFALVLVELHEDEEPVDQTQGRPKRTLSSDAHLMVTSPMYIRYLTEMFPRAEGWNERSSRQYAKDKLEVESLGDLDRNPEKARAFHEIIRKPYARWNNQEV